MTIVGCQPPRALTTEQKNTLFTVQMEILHLPDASLIGLYSISTQTKVSACAMEKTEMYCILLQPSCLWYKIPTT